MHVARVSREHVYHDACLKIQQVHVIVSQPHPHHQLLSLRCTRSGPLCQECPADTSSLPVNDHLLSLAVLDSRIVLVNKMVLDQLNCRSTTPQAPTTTN